MEITNSSNSPRSKGRRSSLFRRLSPQNVYAPDDKEHQYVAQLENEKMEWKKLQQTVIEGMKITKLPFQCDMSKLNLELKNYCNRCPDTAKFHADSKAFSTKLEFYKRMENYHATQVKYAEDRLKEKINEETTKIFVKEIEEKIYLK